MGEVRAYQINRDEFKALLSQQPRLSWWFIEALCAQRQQAERKLRNILTQTVEMRVLGTLKELSEVFGVRCVHGYALEIRLTQQDLADLVGASRSVVSTVMNELRRRGMLDYTRDLICINDPALSDLRTAKSSYCLRCLRVIQLTDIVVCRVLDCGGDNRLKEGECRENSQPTHTWLS